MQKAKQAFVMFAVLILVTCFAFLPKLMFRLDDAKLFSADILRPTADGQLSAKAKENYLANEMYLRKHIYGERFLKWTPMYDYEDNVQTDTAINKAAHKAVLDAVNSLEASRVLCTDTAEYYRAALSQKATSPCIYNTDEMGFCQYAWNNGEYSFTVETEPQYGAIISFASVCNTATAQKANSLDLLNKYTEYLKLNGFEDFEIKENANTETAFYNNPVSAYSKTAQLYIYAQQSSNAITLGVFPMSTSEYDELSK
ncbi:MAG: hypothetical protein RR349_04620 [Oscillospiraceae bacterium]